MSSIRAVTFIARLFWILTLLLSDRAYRDGVADGLKRGFDRLEVLDLAVVVPANLLQEVEARLSLSVRGFGFRV